MATFPRLPTNIEKEQIAAVVFRTTASQVNFKDVWMLAPEFHGPGFNCMGWSILVNQVIPIYKLSTVEYLAGNAVKIYGAPYDYTPTTYGAPDALIRVWGSAADDVMHVSRFCTIDLLKEHAVEFEVELDFDAPPAQGFPKEIWSSKYGVGNAFITHPKDWLENSVWGKGLKDLKQLK